jgi:hypothetical protein
MFDPSRNSASASDGSTARAAANGAGGCGTVAVIPVGEYPPHIGMGGIGGAIVVLCCAGVP